ncbi:hypothetical protein [Streptomyces sp. bgisy159]|uniref:hypothetical protein n=1 Tax=Streptomyces sp. bgisy159 TaxID=3413795 RepID=UPI003F49FEF6
MRRTGGRRVRAAGLWWRVDFDGRHVTVVRRWVPVPGLRARRYPLADVISADFSYAGGEDELRSLDLFLRGDRILRVGGGTGFRAHLPWFTVCEAIEAAIRARELHVLRSTVGLGPWSEQEWARVEALVPEITAFADHTFEDRPGALTTRVEIGHRVEVEALLTQLRDETKPYVRTGGRIALKWRNADEPDLPGQQRIRARGEAWATLLERLQVGTEVTATASWTEQAEAILDAVARR